MNRHKKQIKSLFIFLSSLAVLSLACSSITISLDSDSSTPKPDSSTQQIGFDFINQTPAWPEGDASAGRHLFLHKYQIPAGGFITGVTYLNDSDSVPESLDLLVLRPGDKGWRVIYRMSLSDDVPPARTGITLVNLPYPLPVQKDDIFAHWQDDPGGAIPLNGDDESSDGLSAGQYGFQSSEIEVGQYIQAEGFSGHRDYFVNVIYSTDP